MSTDARQAPAPRTEAPHTEAPHSEDTAARERIRTSLDESLVVEAAAGTGKTTVLVDRLVAVLADGRTTVDRLVAVTFTRKAAGELKLRLRQELDRERQRTRDAVRRGHLAAALARLEEAHVGTIHSFCAEILRRRPVEAGLDPAFVEMEPEQADALYEQAFRAWAGQRLDALPPGLARALQRLAIAPSFDGDSSPLDRLRDAGRELVDWRDFEAPWARHEDPEQPFDRAAALASLVRRTRKVARMSRQGRPKDPLRRALEPVEDLAHWMASSAGSLDGIDRERHLDELEAQFVELLKALRRKHYLKGRGTSYARGLERETMLAARDQLVAALEDFDRRAGAELASLLRDELWQVLDGYEQAKQAAGRVDFLDLLVRSRDLLRDHAEVRRNLQTAFSHVFVDEFQDTDPLQAEILLLLAADDPTETDWRQTRPLPGKLFLVGDPKQSIYRFRRADVLLYQGIREQLEEAGVGLVVLRRSFRSIRPLQRAINLAFGAHMQEDRRAGQPAYVALDGDREAPASQPSLVALPVPAPFGWSRPSGRSIDASLPVATCAFVDWLIHHSGWTVVDPEDRSRRVPIAPRHICLLFRRYLSWGRDVTEPYLRGFEARGIPHLLVGGRSFHQREEVETLRTAATAIEWPDDTLSVYATLRGDLFGFQDEELLRHLGDRPAAGGALDPLAAEAWLAEMAKDDPRRPILEALALLGELHRGRNAIPFAETLHRLLEATRAHAAFALRPAGNQVLVNVRRVIDLARAFEGRGGLSFRGFVDHLDHVASRPGQAPAPALEEGAEGVRLMTTHTAKGLEFPVVLLADPTCRLTARDPSFYLDTEKGLCARRLLGCSPWELLHHRELELEREAAEGVRVAYVAATRARDLLVVPGLGIGPFEDSWLGPLDRALYPEPAAFTHARPAPGTPPFGRDTVLEGPKSGDPRDQRPTIRPGLHLVGGKKGSTGDAGDAKGEGAAVAWWDPRTLDLRDRGPVGLRAQQVLEPDPEGRAVAEGLERYQDWIDDREAALGRGSRPSREPLSITELEQDPPGPAVEISIESVRGEGEKGSAAGDALGGRHLDGRRFGTLVHTVLRDLAFDAAPPAIEALVRLHARALAAPDAEIRAATEGIEKALDHPLMVRAAGAERVLREAPFQLRLDGGFQVVGAIDLAFLHGGRWTVVDFKTDADPGPRLDAYRRQLAWYVHALAALTDQPADGVLLTI